MAAGLRLRESSLPDFTHAFTERINALLPPDHLTPALRVDCDAALSELTPRAVEGLERLGPFGQGNPSPSVRVTRVRVARPPEPLGAAGKHLALRVADAAGAGAGRELRLIGWDMGRLRDRLALGAVLDVVVRPRMNVWNGRATVEPELRDALVHASAPRAALAPR
jgi:single-stranded-DNA-specific exonuclease